MEMGSWADWASAGASFAATAIALWLSGQEKRRRVKAEHPTIGCTVEPAPQTASEHWGGLSIRFRNTSGKTWLCYQAALLSPSRGALVRSRDTRTKTDGSSFAFDPIMRATNAKRSIPLAIELLPAGISRSSFDSGGGPGDFAHEILHVKMHAEKPVHIRLSFKSLEPVPDRFHIIIKREASDFGGPDLNT